MIVAERKEQVVDWIFLFSCSCFVDCVATIDHGGRTKNRLANCGFFCLFCSQKSAKKGGGGKKPLSGFMLFSKEHRPKIKEDNPDISFGQIGKKLGEMWRALSDKEKEAYKAKK